MPKITLRLNDASIAAAIKEVKKYKADLREKAEKIRIEVAKRLANLCEEGFNGAAYDDVLYEGTKVPDVSVTVDEKENITLVIAHGKEAIFAEFGAGVYYNPSGSPHPSRPAGIVAIGEYGYGYGKRKVWGYYDESGELKLTHGTPASAPVYFAAKEIVEQIPEIAKEVFKGG